MHRHQCAGQICGVYRLKMGEIQVLGTMKQMMMKIMIVVVVVVVMMLITGLMNITVNRTLAPLHQRLLDVRTIFEYSVYIKRTC